MSINPEVIRSRCQEIADSVMRLERIGPVSREQFHDDQDLQDIACYRLQVAVDGPEVAHVNRRNRSSASPRLST